MTDYSLPPNSTATITLNDGDTLTISPVGAVAVTGADAVVLDLTGTSGPPGIDILNQGTIQSLTGRAIDTQDPSGGAPKISLTNEGTITSPDDAFRIDDGMTGGTILVDNYGTIDATGSGQAIDFNIVEAAASITIINRAGGLIHAANADGIRPGAGAVVHNYGHIQARAVATASTSLTTRAASSTTTPAA